MAQGGGAGGQGSNAGSEAKDYGKADGSRGEDQANWARFKDTVRRAVRQSDPERYQEEDAAAIRAFHKRLGQEGRK
jgi:hypothetical protein